MIIRLELPNGKSISIDIPDGTIVHFIDIGPGGDGGSGNTFVPTGEEEIEE